MSSSKKIFRDPIHNLISFDKENEKVLLDILDSREFQRLKRIKQLGFSYFTYPGSNHDRFSHSLGVCHLAGQIFDKLELTNEITFKDEKGNHTLLKSELRLLIRISALLHDIGHGPFSHVFEKITDTKHEKMTIRIIESESLSIKSILSSISNKKINKNIHRWVKSIINRTFPLPWVHDIISSQIDVDRMDYLLRDAYMCGVSYARFDKEWIFNNIQIHTSRIHHDKNILVLNAQKGIQSIESFIISRFHMYEQVYFHKTTRGFECITRSLLLRVKYLLKKNNRKNIPFLDKYLLNFLLDNNDLQSYINLDDNYLMSHFLIWSQNAKDRIVQTLSDAIINRKPFKLINECDGGELYSKQISEIINDKFDKEEKEYFILEDSYIDNPYKDDYLLGKSNAEDSENVWVITPSNEIKEISTYSDIIKDLRNKSKKLNRLFIIRDKAKYFQR